MSITDTQRKKRRIFTWVSIALFVLSLPLPAYTTSQSHGSFMVLLVGAFSIFGIGSGCFSGICWMANPALLASWLFKKQPVLSLRFSLLASVLSALFLLFGRVLDNEAGHCNPVTTFEAGYWLWLGSSLVMLAGNLLAKERSNTGT